MKTCSDGARGELTDLVKVGANLDLHSAPAATCS